MSSVRKCIPFTIARRIFSHFDRRVLLVSSGRPSITSIRLATDCSTVGPCSVTRDLKEVVLDKCAHFSFSNHLSITSLKSRTDLPSSFALLLILCFQLQFHQFGIEHMHSTHAYTDVHTIEMAWTIIEQLQISECVHLEINSLGDEASRANYRVGLETYLKKHKDSLSPLSKSRLERGSVLRVLDSKEEADAVIVQDAPTLSTHLSPSSSSRFKQVLEGLDSIGLKYTINQRLVRGLDYYNDTCFEFVTKADGTGPGHAVIAGGRYDKLAEIMGGQSTPGIGWAAGIERLALLTSDKLIPDSPRPVAIIPVSESGTMDEMWSFAMRLTHSLRANGVTASICYEATPAKHTKRAAKENCKYCVYVGSDELAKGKLLVKDMDTAKQFECTVDELHSMFPLYIPKND